MALSLAGMCVRADLAGVSSLVRVLGLRSVYYDRLLDFFHSSAMDPERLSQLWTSIVLTRFPNLFRVNNRLVLLADGIKVGKAGRKMPAVKTLKQVESNTKPAFIRGHSCQAISIVVGAEHSAFAVPLAARIHEGVVYSNRHRKTQTQNLPCVSGWHIIGARHPVGGFRGDAIHRQLANLGAEPIWQLP